MNYTEKLNQAKSSYPFARWRRTFERGLSVYTREKCDAMLAIFDDLIVALIAGSALPPDSIPTITAAAKAWQANGAIG